MLQDDEILIFKFLLAPSATVAMGGHHPDTSIPKQTCEERSHYKQVLSLWCSGH